MKQKTISMSRLGRAMKCYDFSWQTSEAAMSGRVFHKILEKLFTKQKMSDDEYTVAYSLLDKFRYNLFLTDKNDLLVEKELYSNEFGNGYKIHGILDFVQIAGNKALIIDWKTGHRVYDPETIQSLFYSILIFDNYPEINEVVFSLAFTRYGVVKSIINTRDELIKLKGEAEEYIDEYEKIITEKILQAGTHCVNCKNRFSCKQIAYRLKPDKENILDLIATYKALTEERDKIKTLIEALADERSDEDLKKLGVKFKVTERKTITDKKGAIEYIKSLGYDMSQIPVSITLTDVKKLDKSIPDKLNEAGYIKATKSVKMDI